MPNLRVMSLNIGSLFEPEWDRRRNEVVAWIDRVEPDVVCLQEVTQTNNEDNTARWLAEQATASWHVEFGGYAFDQPGADSDRLFGSAVLSRWPIDRAATHRLPTAPDPDDPIPAIVPWELLHVQTAGLDLFSTHLSPAPQHGRHRRLQVMKIDELIKSARGATDALVFGERRTAMPPILCGDFNAEPDSDEIRFLRGLTPFDERTTFYQDAWSVAGDGGPGYTQDWRTHELAAALNLHRKRIDYVFVGDQFMRAKDAGRVHDATVICDQPLTGVQASDHQGLLVNIEWPSRPS